MDENDSSDSSGGDDSDEFAKWIGESSGARRSAIINSKAEDYSPEREEKVEEESEEKSSSDDDFMYDLL